MPPPASTGSEPLAADLSVLTNAAIPSFYGLKATRLVDYKHPAATNAGGGEHNIALGTGADGLNTNRPATEDLTHDGEQGIVASYRCHEGTDKEAYEEFILVFDHTGKLLGPVSLDRLSPKLPVVLDREAVGNAVQLTYVESEVPAKDRMAWPVLITMADGKVRSQKGQPVKLPG